MLHHAQGAWPHPPNCRPAVFVQRVTTTERAGERCPSIQRMETPEHASAALQVEREKIWLVLLMAWAAGFVDALGYLTFIHVFTSHMSGNTVGSLCDLAQGRWDELLRRGTPIPCFLFGLIVGGLVETVTKRRGFRRRLSLVLMLEIGFLIAALLVGPRASNAQAMNTRPLGEFLFLIGCLSLAMGLHSTVLRRVRGQSIHTAFITGMLVSMTEDAVATFFHWIDWLRGRPLDQTQPGPCLLLSRTALFAGIYATFTVGVFAGAFSQLRWGRTALVFPIAILMGIFFCDLVRPIRHA